MKPTALAEATSDLALSNVDPRDVSKHIYYRNIDVGFEAVFQFYFLWAP